MLALIGIFIHILFQGISNEMLATIGVFTYILILIY